jgi:type I restriction enzyme S subunit
MNNNNKTALVPRLRFPEFAINGAINFETGDVIFEPISNKNHNSDLPVLAITQEHGAIPRDQIDYNVSVTDKSLESYKVVEIGDFIISLRSFQGGIEYSLYHGICSPAYIILRKRVLIVDQYYKHYFKTGRFIQDLNKDLEGIRDGKMVSYSQFSAIMLPKPDRKEQQKIADCLSSIDDLIAAEDKKLESLKAHKKGLMQKLFPAEGKTLPELRFPEFRGSGEWVETSFKQVFRKLQYGVNAAAKEYDGKNKYIRITDIDESSRRYLSEKAVSPDCELDDTFLVREGDILFVRTGASTGKSYIYTTDDGILYFAGFLIRGNVNEKYYPQFIFAQTLSTNYEKWVAITSTRSGQPGINANEYESFMFSCPSFPEQQKIADCLSSTDDLISKQAKRIEALKLHKKGLMQGLFPSIEEVGE